MSPERTEPSEPSALPQRHDGPREGTWAGLEVVGDPDGGFCVDGVCRLPEG